YNILGEGTRMMAHKKEGEFFDILGPLGNGFNLDDNFETAVIVAGGLGAAPFPFLTRKISDKKNIITFIGGRNKRDVITYGMKNILTASDDGSVGMKGTVVDLFKSRLQEIKNSKPKIFGCGPNVMLRALKQVCIDNDLNCEVSTEGAMACG